MSVLVLTILTDELCFFSHSSSAPGEQILLSDHNLTWLVRYHCAVKVYTDLFTVLWIFLTLLLFQICCSANSGIWLDVARLICERTGMLLG